MRPVYMISGGITKFAKSHPDKDFRLMVKEAFDYALADIPALSRKEIDGSVCSYFSDHFTRQLKAGAMVQDYLGLCPKPSRRIEGGGATGGLCLQSAWEAVASGRMEVCLAMGFETMSRVNTWKGNEFIALASDTNFDYPVGGFYTGYYAMMVRRHMFEFGTTVEQMAKVAVDQRKVWQAAGGGIGELIPLLQALVPPLLEDAARGLEDLRDGRVATAGQVRQILLTFRRAP